MTAESCSSALTPGLLPFVPGPVVPRGVIFICLCPACQQSCEVGHVQSYGWELEVPPCCACVQHQARQLCQKETLALELMFGGYLNFVSIAVPEHSLVFCSAQKSGSVFPQL